MSGTITINIDLNVTVAKKRGYFLASCEQLDVHAEGDSPEDAMRHVHDALQGFLRTCLEMGTLEQVMRESGFSRIVKRKRAPVQKHGEVISFPFMLGSNHGGQQRAHAR